MAAAQRGTGGGTEVDGIGDFGLGARLAHRVRRACELKLR